MSQQEVQEVRLLSLSSPRPQDWRLCLLHMFSRPSRALLKRSALMFVSLSLCLCLSHSSHTRTQTYSQADTQHRFQTPTQRKSKVSYTLSELAGIATPPTQLTFLHLPNFLSVPWRLLLSENMFYSLEKTENPSWNYTCQRLTAQLRVAERL